MALEEALGIFDSLPIKDELEREEFVALRQNVVGLMREFGELVQNEPSWLGKKFGAKAKPYWRATGKITYKSRLIDVILRTNPVEDRNAGDYENSTIGIAMVAGTNGIAYVVGAQPEYSSFRERRGGVEVKRFEGTAKLRDLDADFFEALRAGLEWYRK